MKICAIIQARMGSTRLPGKVLAEVAGRPMLALLVERVKRAERLDEVMVATTTSRDDDPVEELCARDGIACFRGSELDVLDRYHGAADAAGADVIVRLTADCPLLDPTVIDRVIARFQEGAFDYVSNIEPPTYPDGLDTEVFPRTALAQAWREARLPSEREHVTPYLRNHPELFRQGNVEEAEDWSYLRWTVDEPRDLRLVREIYARMPHQNFGWRDVLALLNAEPELRTINEGIDRNEGMLRSLQDDALFRTNDKS